MKRENYKVAVNSAEEAEMFRQALLSIGEPISEYYEWHEMKADEGGLYCPIGHDKWAIATTFMGVRSCSLELISFKELIKLLVNIKEPLFIAEDDTEMYEDSECHWVYESNGKWHYNNMVEFCKNHVDMVTNQPHIHRAFGTEENAHHWIDKMNKPKEIEIELNSKGGALINKDGIIFNGTVHGLSIRQLTKINEAITQLNQS